MSERPHGDRYGDRDGAEPEYLANDVKVFVKKLNRSLARREVEELQNLYEKEFVAITDRFYKANPWPTAETVSPVVDADRNFLVLYKDLYYRHIYNRLASSVSVDDRFNSFHNYINLFNTLLGLTTSEPELRLPLVWLWDMIDEFIYQFRSFHTMRGSRRKGDTNAEEMQLLKDHPHVWSAQTVIQYLHALVNKARKTPQGTVAPFFQSAADFSLIGLCRVNCLLGDYYGALQALDTLPMDMSKRPYYNGQGSVGIIACHATLHYYMSFAYVMLKRFSDAIAVIQDVLTFINRNKQWLPRSYQEANITKKQNNMLSLLMISVALNPQTLDDGVKAMLRDSPHVNENEFMRMQSGDLLAFETVFESACPKFINPALPDFESPSHVYDDVRAVQMKMFMAEVQERVGISELTGILQLCNTINTKKLAGLAKKEEDVLLPDLISFKVKSKQLKHEDARKPAAHGVWVHSSPVNFHFRNDVLHVSEFVEVDRYGEYFMSQILKYEDFIDEARQVR